MNCYYWNHIFFGTVDILLFNLSIMIGYKIYGLVNTIYEFAVKGNLPTSSTITRNKVILNIIWFLFIGDALAYILLNTYWTFINRDIAILRIFNFSNRMAQVLVILVNGTMFLISRRKISMTLSHTKVD